jgi:hypothetical protein
MLYVTVKEVSFNDGSWGGSIENGAPGSREIRIAFFSYFINFSNRTFFKSGCVHFNYSKAKQRIFMPITSSIFLTKLNT